MAVRAHLHVERDGGRRSKKLEVAFRLSSGDYGHSCCACKNDPQYRRFMGCDGDAPVPQGFTTCLSCDGDGCDECAGQGSIPHMRCPRAMLKDSGEVIAALNYFHETDYPNGPLPGAGGLLDQPESFLRAMRFLQRLKNKRAKAMAEAEAARHRQ